MFAEVEEKEGCLYCLLSGPGPGETNHDGAAELSDSRPLTLKEDKMRDETMEGVKRKK